MTMSLETKLVVSSIALLAVVSAVIATATTLLFNDFLTDRLDLQVSSAARRSTSTAVQPPPEAREVSFLLFPGQAVDTFGARVRDGVVRRAAVLTGVGTVRQVQAPPELARVTGRPVTVSLGPLGDYRMVGVRAPDGDLLVTGLPVLGVQTTLTRLVVVEAAVTLAGVAVVAVAATLLVRRAVRPLGRLAATAARVSELPLATGEAVRLARVPEVDTDPRTEIGQVGGALNRMLGHVETAFAVRHESETRLRRFIADASHELRTPLASIVGYAELTRRGGEPHGPQTTHALGRIRSEAGRMTTLVEDLLLLARLDAGRPLERAELDLSPIVVNAVSDAYAAAPGHRWLVSLPDQPVLVVGDADRLHQVVTNLLANARTHTPPGTTVTTTVLPEAIVRVADDGPGIPAHVLPHVFGRFARGDGSRSRLAGGSGLGLAIVSAVAAAHDGRVEVASVPGNTVFTLSLPSRDQVPPGEGGPPDAHEHGGDQRERDRGGITG
ncbi:two-component system, OmpR family, sensor kinase [Nonomuraea solani]|uniref:histidine kinase n=1 Tax=Nonomuraea solani TaxID=1144553 RepID=A0A1H6EJL2_9ACTN|nr:HAMP domain-containing sensor histidine kinase [Nonomuraea solani]SEG98067.1 two-component system, OmpR family, sensor kinase [Nonomuraea solani]